MDLAFINGIREAIGTGFVIFGVVFSVLGVLGILRLPDTYSRLHASGKVGTLGVVGICIGAAILMPSAALKVLALSLFLILTGPVSSHAIAAGLHRHEVRILLANPEHPAAQKIRRLLDEQISDRYSYSVYIDSEYEPLSILTSVNPNLCIGEADTLTNLIDMLPQRANKPLPVFIVLCDDEIPRKLTGRAHIAQVNCNSRMGREEIKTLLVENLAKASTIFQDDMPSDLD
ncbi:MAG: monovalent cation/H(+) antiporter subunit G [Anaerolineae bacterium]|nr:monovalent cation/H(+) antiporter subunit G [Anaerolineae bacterium]MCA9887954.1 monovalent cation/H(+) antiporter subunit G [Anaerolineae bacterium]MCA9892881.1 monovalent cation/H(+) antiporter subunit G [Anaerolineae bacterium]